jgi:TctA family transporter
MLQEFLRTMLKVTVASLVAGAILGHFGVTPDQLMQGLGLSQERVSEFVQRGWAWALPNLLLGAMVIVPVWFLVFLFRPPRPRND